jgi:hypothetical protein
MKDLGVAKQILGMRIIRDRANSTLKISQTEYVKKILNRFSMDGAKSVNIHEQGTLHLSYRILHMWWEL